MYLIVEGYKNAEVHILIIKETGEIWTSMKDIGSSMGVKKLVLKEIYGICETKRLQKSKLRNIKYQNFKKFGNLSEDEFNAKDNKTIYVRNDVMSTIIKCCIGEKKEP